MYIQFLQDNWMMAALAVVSGAMLIWSFIGSRLSGVDQADGLSDPNPIAVWAPFTKEDLHPPKLALNNGARIEANDSRDSTHWLASYQ